MPHLCTMMVAILTALLALGVPVMAKAQDSSDLFALTETNARGAGSAVLANEIAFSVRLVHSVKFPLTSERCYYQIFVDALGSSPLAEARFVFELSSKGQIVGQTTASVNNLDGQRISQRIREFAFDGPCRLDGVRIVEATGDYVPEGENYTVLVDLLERQAVIALDFEPLVVALGENATLPGAPPVKASSNSVNDDLERSCVVRTSNLRTGPGTEFNIVTVMQQGLAVFTEKRTGDGTWHKVRTQFGRQGWVYYTLLGGCPG